MVPTELLGSWSPCGGWNLGASATSCDEPSAITLLRHGTCGLLTRANAVWGLTSALAKFLLVPRRIADLTVNAKFLAMSLNASNGSGSSFSNENKRGHLGLFGWRPTGARRLSSPCVEILSESSSEVSADLVLPEALIDPASHSGNFAFYQVQNLQLMRMPRWDVEALCESSQNVHQVSSTYLWW